MNAPTQFDKAAGFRGLSSVIRQALASTFGMSFGDKRDVKKVFGYPDMVTAQQMRDMYLRGGIAARIVRAFPDAVWSSPPRLTGSTAFDAAWEELVSKHRVWSVLHRLEILARLSRYSIVVFGLPGETKDAAVRGTYSIADILYMQPYSEHIATISAWGNDPQDERYRRPISYGITPEDISVGVAMPGTTISVHWTRCAHITQEVLENDLYGIPVLEPIWNWLTDLTKVVGASAENFWLTANRGLQVDIDKDLKFTQEDEAALSDELEEYQHQLRRIIRTRGVTIKDLGTTVADPEGAASLIIRLISGSTGIPTRILLGAESGHLASSQDKGSWAERIEEYRRLISSPHTLAPFVKSLQYLGVLPESEVWAEWPDAYRQSPLERGQTSAQTARTAANLVKATVERPELLSLEEMRRIIGLSTEGAAMDDSALIPGETTNRHRIV